MGRDPIRTYFNRHFEAVKDEVRFQVARSQQQVVETVTDASTAAEQRAHQLDERVERLEAEVKQLSATVDDLRLVTAQLAQVVAPLLERRDGPPA